MSQPLSAISVFSVTAVAAGAIALRRFVKFDGTQAGDGDGAWGVSSTEAKAGDAVMLDVIAQVDMIAAAPIPRGSEVQSNADGQPIVKAAGALLGHAVTEAVNPGDIVTILFK